MSKYSDKVNALFKYLLEAGEITRADGITRADIHETRWGELEVKGEDFKVLTDGEADELARESIENYIDDCVLLEMPENLQPYFDHDKFTKDVLMDGRGVQIANYDHEERVVRYKGQWLFIYRTN